jgi:hypothetical protein
VNIDGEVGTIQGDPRAILDEIQRLYRLAEDALAREIDRDRSGSANGRRDQEPPRQNGTRNGSDNPPRPGPNHDQNGGQKANGQEEAATKKQVQYLLVLGKRQELSTNQIEVRIQEITGKQLTVYQLSKREAGRVIDSLTQVAPANGRP